ncbi:hypothetical protein CA11_53150 [Gimesia maris]|uniref:hypothetical protein n=1 Tax=Gimesia maris TaxID=122 RepID=UPI00118BD66E|nr:hypothetical protein [Gimesia maris]QDU17473.1 hypothetical protein CA11_53150 [Gimesia maris]
MSDTNLVILKFIEPRQKVGNQYKFVVIEAEGDEPPDTDFILIDNVHNSKVLYTWDNNALITWNIVRRHFFYMRKEFYVS